MASRNRRLDCILEPTFNDRRRRDRRGARVGFTVERLIPLFTSRSR